MATIKSYSDFQQSKKLAEFLPLESADMHYNVVGDAVIGDYQSGMSSARSVAKAYKKNPDEFAKNVIPCWSLAALLSVLPSVITREGKRMFLTLEKAGSYNLYYKSPDRLDELWATKEEVIDACVAMIELLHEFKML